jgi:hypothetical protein
MQVFGERYIILFNKFNKFSNEPARIKYSIHHIPKIKTVYSRHSHYFIHMPIVSCWPLAGIHSMMSHQNICKALQYFLTESQKHHGQVINLLTSETLARWNIFTHTVLVLWHPYQNTKMRLSENNFNIKHVWYKKSIHWLFLMNRLSQTESAIYTLKLCFIGLKGSPFFQFF